MRALAAFLCVIAATSAPAAPIGDQITYSVRFAKEWQKTSTLESMDIWRNTSDESGAMLSITRHAGSVLPATLMGPGKTIPAVALASFSKDRAAALEKVGIKNWNLEKASRKEFGTARKRPILDLQGTYTAPSGSVQCFFERQVEATDTLFQMTLTKDSARRPCDWSQLAAWLDQVTFN